MSDLVAVNTNVKLQATPLSEPVITVSHVYKQYRRYAGGLSLRHEAGRVIQSFFQRYGRKQQADPFYALRDISFTVRRGEALGIVGRNGAGKTTLLRLLSNITRPTMGTIEVNGRFATLIGLSAGFNPEMTGRQNIYLNAAFFGWKPRDVRALEKDIIEFSELENDFIDAPTKVYSTGMVTRLGFSIAIHVLPEIVFLDEVLATGDAGFAAKCEKRIRELRDEGRTIVMVNHSQKAIQSMCTRAIWLRKGELILDGATAEVLDAYNESLALG